MNQKEFRPNSWDSFVGQEQIISNLKVYTQSSLIQNKCLDNILIHGPSGMGKTTLAFLISKALKVKIHYLNGPNLQKPSEIVAALSSIKENNILFIDEVHAVSKEVLEILYPVLDSGKMNIILGKDFNSKVINLTLPPFTLIVATTELNKIPFAFINRFSINFELQNYSKENLKQIVINSSRNMGISIDDDSAMIIANHCRNIPRIANNLIKRINDYLIIENKNEVDKSFVRQSFLKMGIYQYGLTNKDIEYLKILNNSNYAGLETLSQILNTPSSSILNFIEPLLLKEGLITRTFKGRRITDKGREYLIINKKNSS